MSSSSRYAVIVAGGKGNRMENKVAKQFLPIAGKPVLLYTLEAFAALEDPPEIHLVLPESELQEWESIRKRYGFEYPVHVTPGGHTRSASVQKGIANIQAQEGIVAIHDGVRPFPGTGLINNCYQTALHYGTAVPGIPLKDSVRFINNRGNSKALDREYYRLVQTPQAFSLPLIRDAFQKFPKAAFSDEASLAEAAGYDINLIEGTSGNIKITYPEDISYAEALLKR